MTGTLRTQNANDPDVAARIVRLRLQGALDRVMWIAGAAGSARASASGSGNGVDTSDTILFPKSVPRCGSSVYGVEYETRVGGFR